MLQEIAGETSEFRALEGLIARLKEAEAKARAAANKN